MKIAYQGIAGSYSESCARENYPDSETISCKTFDECFELANNDNSVKAIIPESNKTTGNIGVEYLIFKYRLNIFAEPAVSALTCSIKLFLFIYSDDWLKAWACE